MKLIIKNDSGTFEKVMNILMCSRMKELIEIKAGINKIAKIV
jgi:hypothetical protein